MTRLIKDVQYAILYTPLMWNDIVNFA